MAPLIELEHVFHIQQGFVRPLREGREAVKNLIDVRLKSKTNEEAQVEAPCVRTTKINDEPVKIKVTIDLKAVNVATKIKAISCSCPAGASTEHVCKHAMATVIYLEKNDEDKIEFFTCTDTEQSWGQLAEATLSQFNPTPLKDFCHVVEKDPPYRRQIKEVTGEMEAEFRTMYLSDEPFSEAAVFETEDRLAFRTERLCQQEKAQEVPTTVISHAITNTHYILKKAEELGSSCYLQCTPEEKQYYDEHIKISYDSAVKLNKETLGQDNDLWEKARHGRITGSIFYSFYTYSKNKNPDWNKKLVKTYDCDFQGNEFTMRGLMFESDARECYERIHNGTKIVTTGFLVNPIAPWLGYSADGIIFKNNEFSQLWECKTPGAGKTHGAATICGQCRNFMVDSKLKSKHPYYGQVQLGMLLTSLKSCEFTIYCDGKDEIFVDTVTFNETFCMDMVDTLTEVFFKQILPWLISHGSR